MALKLPSDRFDRTGWGGGPLDREGRTPMNYAAENLWLQGMEEVRRLMEKKEK